MSHKKENYQNDITYFFTSSKSSYTKIAEKLFVKMKELGSEQEIPAERVKEWANGTSPHDLELEAITMFMCDESKGKLKYNAEMLKVLYFPSNEFTLNFIKYNIKDNIVRVLATEKIDSFIKNRNLSRLYNGL